MRSFLPIVLTATLAASCIARPEDREHAAPAPSAAPERAPSPAQSSAPAPSPQAKFTDAERAFAKAKADLMAGYYDESVGEEEIYRAAVQGMLEHLDPAKKGWQKLLSPAELAEMRATLSGEIVGIGVEIKFDSESGYTDVLRVLPKSAAERAGVLMGDKVVSVDGKLFKGMNELDVITTIRGKAGEPVTLSVLRGDKLLSITITRELVSFAPVEHFLLEDHVGYLRIRTFSDKTTAAARDALNDLSQKGAQALILDLRHNQGGAFDESIAAAGLFLPKGTPVVITKKRGGKEETLSSKGDPVLGNVPLKVLVNHDTSSSAELLAGALQEGRKAQLVGHTTYGKWTVQSIEELGNGYAIKYTVAQFRTPEGRSFEGEGMPPDVEVDMDEKATARAMSATDPAKRLLADGQLRTALGLFDTR